jgi:holo-[acyl-carrier protein] synthase
MSAWIGMVIVSLEALPGRPEEWSAGCFTPAELDYAMGFRNRLDRLAARFCAKRAFELWCSAKAGPLPALDEVEILGPPFGSPRLSLKGEALKVVAARGVKSLHLSLSHCQGYAGALLAVNVDGDGA